MDIHDLHPPDDYSHRFFIWHEWIQANGPLTTENVFDYFATSMFYDKQSNNQVLRMQTMHTGVPVLNEAAELKRFTGIEFALVHSEPPAMFVIQKRERLSPDEVRPLAAYFISNNRIYQSPDIYTVLSNRLLTSLHSLQSSLDTLRQYRPDYAPRTGFIWPIVDPTSTSDAQKKRGTSVEAEDAHVTNKSIISSERQSREGQKRQQNNMLLINAMRTTAIHSNMSFSASSQPVDLAVEAASENAASRASATPGPSTPSVGGPSQKAGASSAPTPKEQGAKAPPGAGKKKRKRTLPSIGA